MMPFIEKEDRIFGPGVLDMKGGLVIALEAIAVLQETGQMPSRPITMLFNTDEETGSYESRVTVECLAKEAALALVYEPSETLEGSLHTWCKGTGKFNIKVQGRAAHSGGAHEKGLNAIDELAHQIVIVQQLTDFEKGTTINIGAVHGGRAINIVPAYAEAEGDMRIIRVKEYEGVENAIRSLRPVLKESKIEAKCNLNRPPMPFDGMMEATFDKAQSIPLTGWRLRPVALAVLRMPISLPIWVSLF